jgi:type III pantothenate kinase
LTVKNFCENEGIDHSGLAIVGISSVVPDLTEIFETVASRYLKAESVVISGSLRNLGMTIEYTDPASVGADRICNAVAGYEKYGGPLIIVDFGTATTFDIVSSSGSYMGGVICLGIESSASELHRRAARLPKVDLRFPSSVIARDTISSMQAGLMFGTLEALEGLVRRIRRELGHEAGVIATGGLATVIARHTKIFSAVEPALVLEGIRIIVGRMDKKNSAA